MLVFRPMNFNWAKQSKPSGVIRARWGY
jgi:hypothetical protein